MNEYELFRIIWWALLGVLLIGLAVMDGFDLGAAMLSPIIGRSDSERRVVINTVGPVWEGNQVWLSWAAGRFSRPGRCSMRWLSRGSTLPCCCCWWR